MITKKAQIIERELLTDGHSPLLVITDDFDRYVAKNAKTENPPLSLINEWICHRFLQIWNIPVPEAALIQVPKNLIEHASLSNHHRLHYYDTVCFGSKYVHNATELNEFVFAKGRANHKYITNKLDFLHTALFDTWVENDDRKPTNHNLLLEPDDNKFKVIAIDHAFVFSTRDYIYLKPDEFHPISNEHILISELGYSIKRSFTIDASFIENERDYFYLCIARCSAVFDILISEVTDVYSTLTIDRITALKAFLFSAERNEKVFNEYLYRLKQ